MKDENDENGECLKYAIPHFAHASFGDYLFNPNRSGPFHVNRQEYENQVTIRSFALIMQSIRSWRMSSTARVLHTTTWDYFTSHLPDRFSRFPKVVKEAIMTDINDLVLEFWRTSSDGAVGASSFFAMRRLLEILQRSFPFSFENKLLNSAQSDLDKTEFRAKFTILFDGYRKMLDQSFSTSKDLDDMLRFLPGVVVQKPMSMQGMADLYRIKSDLLERLIKSTIEPLRRSISSHPPSISSYPRPLSSYPRPLSSYPRPLSYARYILDDYLSGFLQDRDRSQHHYCDPMLQHISICRHFLSLLDGSNALEFQSHDLSDYVSLYFYDHLCAATTVFHAQNISDDHPAIGTMYYPGYFEMGLNCHLKGVAVSVPNVDLMERVCHSTNKIYREMLYITRHERKTIITMSGLHELSAFSSTPLYRIVLSWDLLAWISVEGRIPCSFTNFITTLELSGPWYISPDMYHTQITEYSLQTIYQAPFELYHCLLRLDWSFREHLSHALPTEMIFNLLRSISSDDLIHDYSAELKLDTLEIIIKWLQGLGSERPSDLYDYFRGKLLRHKAALPQPSSSSSLDSLIFSFEV